MKFSLLITALVLSLCLPSMAQTEGKATYPLVIKFQSICCGVPTDSSIRNFIRSFKKQYKIKKIVAYHLGPMGREGEYYLMFKLNELNKKQAGYFVSKIKNIKKLDPDKGIFDFEEKLEIDPASLPKSATTQVVIF